MKTFILFLVSLILISCEKQTSNGGGVPLNSSGHKLMLLKVDYMTHVFEAGKELSLKAHSYTGDSLPVIEEYQAPADFGNLRFLYTFTGDTLFDGSIVWMGTGHIKFPRDFAPASSFSLLQDTLVRPDNSRFQNLLASHFSFSTDFPWSAINKLKVVQDYLASGNKIAYFLYTPSVGIGNPSEWDWLIILRK